MRRVLHAVPVVLLSCAHGGSTPSEERAEGGGDESAAIASVTPSEREAAPPRPGSGLKKVLRPEGGAAPAPEADAARAKPEARRPEDRAELSVPPKERGASASNRPRASSPRPPAPAPAPAPRAAPPASPGVKAGAADDNLAFNAFLRFLADNGHLGLPHDPGSRVVVKVEDRDGAPLHDARVRLVNGDRRFTERRTYTDGRTLLFPRDAERRAGQGLAVQVEHGGATRIVPLGSRRTLTVALDTARRSPATVPLDVAFVLDTTGSMDDEIARLKQTLEVIHFQISHLTPRPDVRFGMVLYRDVGDDYRTRVVPFTRDLSAFQRALAEVRAGGGQDYPEDVQEGLRRTLKDLNWRGDGVQLAFLVGDAPPHLDYGQTYTYLDAMEEAARRGIKIATIGASGLSKAGEVVWRQIAQYTLSPFVFLTYGEKGDSEGSPSTVSHHVGSNWVADALDAIIIRMVKLEIANLTPRGAPVREDYISAAAHMTTPPDLVLAELFETSVRQLLDYSVQRIDPRTPTVVLPLAGLGAEAERAQLGRRLVLMLGRNPAFQLVERDAKAELLDALAEQLSHAYDEKKVAEVGKLVPAELAVIGTVGEGQGGRREVLLKLVRIETGEVLSLSLLKIDPTLLAEA